MTDGIRVRLVKACWAFAYQSVDGLCLCLSERIRVMIPELVVWDTYLAVFISRAIVILY
ncbi:hypothetical protein GIB67_025517 [Kingdonia uniflora]|uniref:Uncharacterized protein n=1 Tax=Kingdonia uniflora TaxID=39325 RepID=A0A7J7PDC7_9MAGN|nr:hypothetical protein GIB67_025517 [Kingdonia uniflora]